MTVWPNHALQRPALALWLQSMRPAGRVAEVGSLGGRSCLMQTNNQPHPP